MASKPPSSKTPPTAYSSSAEESSSHPDLDHVFVELVEGDLVLASELRDLAVAARNRGLFDLSTQSFANMHACLADAQRGALRVANLEIQNRLTAAINALQAANASTTH